MFSRVPQDAAKTCLFIGGRDALLALDMAAAAKAAMFPPFLVSVFADRVSQPWIAASPTTANKLEASEQPSPKDKIV